MASVGEGLGDDEGGQQRRRQQRDDAEQRAGSERPPMTSGPRPFSAIVQAPTTAIRTQARTSVEPERLGDGPGTREHVLVTQGALRTGPVDRATDLRAGAYAGFTADEMHLYEAGPRGARALLIMQWATHP